MQKRAYYSYLIKKYGHIHENLLKLRKIFSASTHTTSKFNMAVLKFLTHCYFLVKFASLVQVKHRLGLVLGLVSSSDQYFTAKAYFRVLRALRKFLRFFARVKNTLPIFHVTMLAGLHILTVSVLYCNYLSSAVSCLN